MNFRSIRAYILKCLDFLEHYYRVLSLQLYQLVCILSFLGRQLVAIDAVDGVITVHS